MVDVLIEYKCDWCGDEQVFRGEHQDGSIEYRARLAFESAENAARNSGWRLQAICDACRRETYGPNVLSNPRGEKPQKGGHGNAEKNRS